MTSRITTSVLLMCMLMLLTAVPAMPDQVKAPAGPVPILQSQTVAVVAFNPCPALPKLEAAEQKLTDLIANGQVPPKWGGILLQILDKAIALLQSKC